MTLDIDTTEVSAVLLADGWHEVRPQSFTVQRIAFTDSEGDGRRKATKLGYQFLEQHGSFAAPETVVVSGPLKAILAVRTIPQLHQTIPEPPAPQLHQTIPEPSAALFHQSLLVRDEIERNRLARAGQPPSLGGLRPPLEAHVAYGDDEDVA